VPEKIPGINVHKFQDFWRSAKFCCALDAHNRPNVSLTRTCSGRRAVAYKARIAWGLRGTPIANRFGSGANGAIRSTMLAAEWLRSCPGKKEEVPFDWRGRTLFLH
jgi:hypothetical protein